MLRPHVLLMWSLAVIGALLPGCASFGLKNGVPYFSKQEQWEPEAEADKWGQVGKDGRGNRKLEDEHDPIKPFVMSKQAQDIERNLGYK